jgi:hypothetical protein
MKSNLTIRRWALAAALTGAAAVVACYPSPDLSIEDFDTVVTVVADDTDFNGLNTYFLPDTVLHRPDDGSVTRDFDDLIIGDINRNMMQLGYVYERDPWNNPPDLLLVASAITQEQYTAYLGWPLFGFGLGGGFVYPTTGVRYLYTRGTITIDMADGEDFDPNDEDFQIVWTASVSGPIEDSRTNKGERITNGIDQAFAQSPYLKPD